VAATRPKRYAGGRRVDRPVRRSPNDEGSAAEERKSNVKLSQQARQKGGGCQTQAVVCEPIAARAMNSARRPPRTGAKAIWNPADVRLRS
jgi:hypothetical protein